MGLTAGDIKPGQLFLLNGTIWLKTKESSDYALVTAAIAIECLHPNDDSMEGLSTDSSPGSRERVMNNEKVMRVDADFFVRDSCIHRTWTQKELDSDASRDIIES